MAVTILCPKLSCRAILSVPDSARGQRVRCSSCGMAFLVPETKAPKKEPVAATSKPAEPKG
jgi:LSD1 subclass zinc finger protein